MRTSILFLFFLLGARLLYAQEIITVKGAVRDAAGETLPGASILEKGSTTNGTVADASGMYQIQVKSNSVLVVSYIGFQTVEHPVGGRTTLDITLQGSTNNLNDVVVTGYGQAVARKDLTGAISSIKGDELAKVPVQNVAEALQGRIAGMQVTMPSGDPGAQPTIKIRGGTSITQSNEPLYVVDGVPQTEGLSFLDPMDIESIEVLKDASATAIYGARGANGVVLVTTKQIKSGKLTVNYDGYYGMKSVNNYIGVLNPYQYALYTYEYSVIDPTRAANFSKNFGEFNTLQQRYGDAQGINWQREVFNQGARNQYHKVSLSGGGADTKFNLFYSKNLNDGLMLQSGSDKDIAKLAINSKLSKKLNVSAIVNFSNQFIYGSGGTQEGGNARLSMLQTLLQYRPINYIGASDLDLLDSETDPLDNASNPSFQSPLVTVATRLREQSNKALNTVATVRYDLLDHLTYNGLVSYTNTQNIFKYFNGAGSITALRLGGPDGGISTTSGNRLNYNNTLTYRNTFSKDHRFDVSVGQEHIYNYSEQLSAQASNFPTVNNGWNNLGLGTVAGFPGSYAADDKLLSFFARSNYGYKDRYLLTVSLRADGSSKFGSDNRWGYFPSVAAAWRIVEEPFMQKFSSLSDLKLRLSYGTAGNNRIPNYAALGTFNSGTYGLGNAVNVTAGQASLPNPTLKWETVQAANLGLDVGLFNQRVTLTAELYDNRSKDLLYNTRIPASSGFAQQLQNIGTTSSRGLEFTLNTVNVKAKDFSWSTNFNIAFNRTKVLSLSEGETSLRTNSYTTVNDYLLEVGRPVGIMYGYQQDGLYQVDDFNYNATTQTYTLKAGVTTDAVAVQPGFVKFKDISGPNGVPDGVINAFDQTVIGNANPKFTGGLSNAFSYKGFDLNVFLNFTVGNDIYNANYQYNLARTGDYVNTLATMANRWMTVNSSGQVVKDPVELAALNAGNNSFPSQFGATTGRTFDRAIEDGSFLRINTVSLGYNLPAAWLQPVKLSRARLYVTAYNLHVFTRYSGYDPEVSVINNALTPGVDFSAYPRGRSILAGLNLTL